MSGIFSGLFGQGTLAGLERSVEYTTARHQALVSNVANADTPGYRRRDVDGAEFHRVLSRAYDRDDRRVGDQGRHVVWETVSRNSSRR